VHFSTRFGQTLERPHPFVSESGLAVAAGPEQRLGVKRFPLIILAALIVGGGWWFFVREKSSAPRYLTTTPARGDITQTVTATGQLNAVLNVQVGSQISGNIQKLFADFNSEVKAGQVVAQLDPATYQAAVHQAEGELHFAKAALELAQLNAKRQEQLASRKVSAPLDLDTALAALHQAEASVKIREAQLERARVDLDRCTIYAPIDGLVISRSVDVGQTVAASLQAPILFTIANDLRKMQIDANVAEADVGSVQVGQAVEFTVDAFPYRTFQGKVAQVRNAPLNVQNVVSYDAVISVDNSELKLKPGMTANVSVLVAQRSNTLKIPNSALRFRPGGDRAQGGKPGQKRSGERPAQGQRTVHLLKDGQPAPVPVRAGITDGVFTEILEGLTEKDGVITGIAQPPPSTAGAQGASSPFGGGMRRY
jgi:HlyD family secretion protein